MQHLVFTFVKWINPSSSSFIQISSTVLSCWPLLYNIMNKLHIHQDSFDVTMKIKCHLERIFTQCLAQWRKKFIEYWMCTRIFTSISISIINGFCLWGRYDISKYIGWIFHCSFFKMLFRVKRINFLQESYAIFLQCSVSKPVQL